MTSDKKEITNDVLMADVMLRLTALETLLINKGIITKEELISLTTEIAEKVSKVVLEKAQTSKNITEFTSSLEKLSKDKKGLNN